MRPAIWPSFRAGWQQPFSPWTIATEDTPELRPLVRLETGDRSLTVGAIDTERRRALLPIYAVTPYLFAGEERIESPHEPSLDATSATLLDTVLETLRATP